jgi:hypothetical protein
MLLKIISISSNFSKDLESHRLEVQAVIVQMRERHSEIEKEIREGKRLMEEATALKNYYNVQILRERIQSKKVLLLKCLAYTLLDNKMKIIAIYQTWPKCDPRAACGPPDFFCGP